MRAFLERVKIMTKAGMGRRAAAVVLTVLIAAGCERGAAPTGGSASGAADEESISMPAEVPPAPQEPSSPPEEEGEKVRYPDAVPEEIAVSASYAEALAKADVILVRGVPVTGGEKPAAFSKTLEAGEAVSLLVYSYDWNGQYHTAAFSGVKGTVTCTTTWYQQYDSVKGGQESKETCGILDLSDYGFLSWAAGTGYELSSLQVINNAEVFPDNAEREAIYRTYLEPFLQCGALSIGWENADELPSATFLYLFEDQNGPAVWQEYGSSFPFEKVKETALRYFEVSDKTLMENKFYNEEHRVYEYEGGRGGGPVCIRAVSAEERNSGTIEVRYEWFSPQTGAPTTDMQFLLTVQKTDDGFRLISNQKLG